MKKKQPIKRSEHLVTLSHEHHHGLVFCTRLKKAGRSDKKTIVAYVRDFWEKDLAAHFEREEKLLLPLLEDNELTKQFLSEHDMIRSRVNFILSTQNKDIVSEAIALSKLVNDHIRFEEKKLFPWLEKELTAEELETLGEKLNAVEVAAHHYSPEFWKS